MIGQKRKGDKINEIINEKNNKNFLNEKEEEKEKEKEIYLSNKPLWIQEVKKSINCFPLSINELEFEKIEEIMNKDDNNETIINYEEYPFYSTIKKIMYSFGDVKEPNKKTIIKISNFINNYISLIVQIIQECDFKKIIDYFYKEEKEKLDFIKKYKHKNFLKSFLNKKENDLRIGNINDDEENDNNISDLDESLDELNIYGEDENEKNIENKDDKKIVKKEIINLEEEEKEYNLNEGNNIKNNIINNNKLFFKKEKDDINKEITIFQDKRTELMDSKTYEDYIKCRQQNFLTRGKKFFLSFLQNFVKEEKFPNELKESNNIELIAFILNEEIKKIITNSIRNKHPNKKLFILTQPLSPEDIEISCQKEIQILSTFLNNFHNDIYMINEYKKKKLEIKIIIKI